MTVLSYEKLAKYFKAAVLPESVELNELKCIASYLHHSEVS